MTLRKIKTNNDYDEAMERFQEIFHAEIETPESDEADVLAILLKEYEEQHFVIEAPGPIEAIP